MSTQTDPRTRRRATEPAARCLVAALVGVLSAACSGTSSSGGANAHSRFVSDVDKVCARAVAAHAGHPFPVLNFDPEHPDPSKLPEVGDYFAQYGGLPQTTSALHRLSPPTSDAGAWRNLLQIADSMTANAQSQIAASRARDVTTFVATVHQSNNLTTRINAAGQRFGFTEQSSCGKVFG